jgi:arginine decarboxylase
MNYSRFFLTAGSGTSRISSLNAFDRALLEAGISQCNLVPVSSIIAPNAVEVDHVDIPPGEITHCVIASTGGRPGKQTTAGISYTLLQDESGKKRYGVVAEDAGHYNTETCEQNLREKLFELAEARGMRMLEDTVKVKTVSMDSPPEGVYSHVIAALIYVE